MTKSKIIAFITLVIASIAASLMIHQRSSAAIQEHAARLQQQAEQLADLKAVQQCLSNLVARAANPRVEDHAVELAKLRGQAEALRKQTKELAEQSKTLPASHTAAKPETHPPEYWKQMGQASGTKQAEALRIATAMFEYARDHQNQYPSTLDQVTPYLAKNNWVLSGTNQFEIIYQGSLDQLDGIPWPSIAAVRDAQTFLTPDGKAARVYGMVPGMSQTVTSDDDFQSWEAEHVISPPNSAR